MDAFIGSNNIDIMQNQADHNAEDENDNIDIEFNGQRIRDIEVPLFELEQKVMRLETQVQTKDFDIDFISDTVCKKINAKPMLLLPTIMYPVN